MLREDGFTQVEIADVLGISRQYVSDLVNDPDGSKVRARKDSYRGTCETCGAPTDGSNGPGSAPKQCATCFNNRRHEERYWTKETVIAAIRRFAAENGRKPFSSEWSRNGPEYAPDVSLVLREFGTWNNAIAAAGFPTEPRGKFKRSPETIQRMRAAQLGRHRTGWGKLSRVGVTLASGQLASLKGLNGATVSEHIRRAIDLYLREAGGDR